MLPSRSSLASKAVLILCTLLFVSSSAYLQPLHSVQAFPTSLRGPLPSSLQNSPPSPQQGESDYASTSGTKPVPDVPYLYSWSSDSSGAPSPRGRKSPAGPCRPGRPGSASPPMSERPFKYIDLSEFRHLLTQPPLPAHQRPKKTRANAPWKKGKGMLEGPPPAPAPTSPEKKKAPVLPAYSLEADVREDPPEVPVGKNVGKTRGGLWRKMAGCFGGCGKKV